MQKQFRQLSEERVRPVGSHRPEWHSEIEGRCGYCLQVMGKKKSV